MILSLDHVTVVVRDVAKAKAFFSLLGFVEEKSVVISGEPFARYMGVDGIEAEHVTLVSKQAAPRFEIIEMLSMNPHPTCGFVAEIFSPLRIRTLAASLVRLVSSRE